MAQPDAGEANSRTDVPEPVLPAFGGPCLAGVVPGLLAHLSGSESALASWMPEAVTEASQIVLLVIDGLGAEQLRERALTWPRCSRPDSAAPSRRSLRAPPPVR